MMTKLDSASRNSLQWLGFFSLLCTLSTSCASVTENSMVDAGRDSSTDAPSSQPVACVKNSPGQTCWNFSDVYAPSDLANWVLTPNPSCWGLSTDGKKLRTAKFPTTVILMDVVCEATLPPFQVTNPKVTDILLKLTQTVKVDGLGNYANIYADVSPGATLLSRAQSQSGDITIQFPVTTGTKFNIRLQLQVGATYMQQDDAWQVQRIEVVPRCNGTVCSLSM